MPITTNLNQSPYYDDYDVIKDYYRILFKPGVSVQVRELNQIQDIFANQLEKFGDNIFKNGSIISGCNYQPYNPFPYIKINDLDVFNNLALPSNYVGFNIINQTTQLSAVIVKFLNGYQTTPPNLKTLYLNYKGANTFSPGDLLTIYDPVKNPINAVQVANGGLGFSNSDQLIFLPAVAVTVLYGSLTNSSIGDFLLDPTGVANVQINQIDGNTYANSAQIIVTPQPRNVDLANAGSTTANWTLTNGQTLRNPANTVGVMITKTIGSGAEANIITNGIGTVIQVPMVSPGTAYFPTIPFVGIRSINNPQIGSANLIAQNYLTQVTVNGDGGAVGNGYAAGVTQGVIYQKGTFLEVAAQQIIIDPYDTQPDGVVMGFTTQEQIISSDVDQTLLDNSNNTRNIQAPGADRLKLTPVLELVNTAIANSNASFLAYATYKSGLLTLLNDTTTYNVIGDQIAQGIEDQAGTFVLEPFLVTTTSPSNTSLEGSSFNIVADKGVAYIDGFKVATVNNWIQIDNKGTANDITNNHIVSLNYGNFLTCNNVSGFFQFNTGATVNLQDTAKNWYANVAQAMNPAGNTIGTASIRSVQYLQGEPGTANAQYNIYLFNILMTNNFNFANVCGICYSNGSANSGLADVVRVVTNTAINSTANVTMAVVNTGLNQGTSHSGTVVAQPTNPLGPPNQITTSSPSSLPDSLLFYTGVDSLKNCNNITYQYMTCNSTLTVGNGAAANTILSITLAAGQWPWSGVLTQGQLANLYVVPTQTNMIWTTIGGNVGGNTTASSNVFSGNNTTANTTFLSQFQAGDYVYVAANAASNEVHQIVSITNNTSMVFNSNVTFSNTACVLYRAFPINVPIPFGYRSGLSANVIGTTLSLNFGTPFTFSGTTQIVADFPVQVNPGGAVQKTILRNQFVVHYTGNTTNGATGPWTLGVPDAFRLDGVYIGNSSVSNTGTNYITNFYLDPHQKPSVYELSRVFLNPTSGLSINATCYILFQFDYMTTPSVGFFDTVSYVGTTDANTLFTQDSQSLSNLDVSSAYLNSFEVPTVFDTSGTEYDLLQCLDFRPFAANTALPGVSPGAAFLNPSQTLTLSTTGEKQFPVPGAQFQCNMEYWMGRTDSIFVDNRGNFTVAQGPSAPAIGQQYLPIQPQGTMKIVDMSIPAYPNLPTNLGLNIGQILQNGVIYGTQTPTRQQRKTVSNYSNTSSIPFNQPAVYTMQHIGSIDRRLANVEYYITLDNLTTSATSMQIPSTANPGSNRFQYGVFVDSFVTAAFSALTDPQYAATKIDPNVVPSRMLWDINLQGMGRPSWIAEKIVSQPFATVGAINDPLGLGPVCALNLANTVAYKLAFRNATDLERINPFANSDTQAFTLANIADITGQIINNNNLAAWLAQAATAPLQDLGHGGSYGAAIQNDPLSWIRAVGIVSASYNPGNQSITIITPNPGAGENFTDTIGGVSPTIGAAFLALIEGAISPAAYVTAVAGNPSVQSLPTSYIQTIFSPPVSFYFYDYDQGMQYEILQSPSTGGPWTLIGGTSSGAPNQPQALTASDIALLTGPAADNWFNDNTTAYLKNPVGAPFTTGAGKIVFNYNPAKGAQFLIRSTFSQNAYRFKWVFAYPINGASVGCVPTQAPTVTLTTTYTPTYQDFTIYSTCGNGAHASGTIGLLTGLQVSGTGTPPPAPVASIVPFNTGLDWAGAAAGAPNAVVIPNVT